jgi:undecaprenyl diphosphate synthase
VTAAALHVAVIMDGNGRWAERHRLPREAGHRAGSEALERIVEAAPRLGVATLTAYAFSADNWKRPRPEVDALLKLFESYLRRDTARLRRESVRLTVIGRRDRLPERLVRDIAAAEADTASGTRLHLRLAIDYSSREAIARAAAAAAGTGAIDRSAIERRVGSGCGRVEIRPPVDLLIRTGGEQRLSDFLLWESAYAELWFCETAWPEFTAADLAAALADFRSRERRFGGHGRTGVGDVATQSPV